MFNCSTLLFVLELMQKLGRCHRRISLFSNSNLFFFFKLNITTALKSSLIVTKRKIECKDLFCLFGFFLLSKQRPEMCQSPAVWVRGWGAQHCSPLTSSGLLLDVLLKWTAAVSQNTLVIGGGQGKVEGSQPAQTS